MAGVLRGVVLAGLWLAAGAAAAAEERVDLDMVAKIRQEAFARSQVAANLKELTETVGPRLTASPAYVRSTAWARGKLQGYGLANVREEVFDPAFGRGWEYRSSRVEMLAPREMPIHAAPKAWTPGTRGAVEGEVVKVALKTSEDLGKHKGTLRGKIVLLDDARAYKPADRPDFRRHTGESLGELQTFPVPAEAGDDAQEKRLAEYRKRQAFSRELNTFLQEEGALAALSISSWDNGILRVTGAASRKAGEPTGVTELVLAAEHYNQLVRAVERKQDVRLRLDVDAGFTSEEDLPAANVFADLPGAGKADEVVIIGAHLDSWHTGTGASDNGAGVVVMMEAMRILKAIGAKPRRTIRLALWGGEEQGLHGSSNYVARYLADWPEPTDPEQKALPRAFQRGTGPLQRQRGYERFSTYFNFDNGTGRIRGIYAQENHAAVPVFKAWLEPFHDLGAEIVSTRNTGSTDHIAFDRVGLPGFQFVQDPADYMSRVHHTHLDTYDHVVPEDLKQAAAIIASFAWHAANREQRFPRKPFRDRDE
ncbi:peptidase M28 [Pseudoxanthomonas suwonensis 11-1]|uniref:Carboxypeptidase Q n=1 Tax=Pseudoxanthomonas suwonensis (strain 11-1) TaxID=743721 RepID=E6WR62_PSEUU|nr:M20/M25/M40 family metallo-hydrolase [Pseudoxanthomonas suwonensis]ADV26807.1 peptidase M28 [Pseudoxanthomonas suwonensis 11-1]